MGSQGARVYSAESMAARISAAKARAHTRKSKKSTSVAYLTSRLWYKALLLVATIFVSWAIMAVRPPVPKVCGTASGPPVTAPRVRLSDGRYLAYKQGGVPKEEARYKVIVSHAYSRSRHDLFPASKDLIEKLGIYIVSFDRAGYGQSDPNSHRTVKSEARDIEELADLLELGPKFFLLTNSIGGYSAWSSMKYIPHRLAGVAMVTPVVNYWWPSLATPEGKAVFNSLPIGDRLSLSVAHYAPWLVYWWMTQTVLPTSSVVNPQQADMCKSDWEIRSMLMKISDPMIRQEAIQQGVFESMHRDMINMFGDWEFDPTELENPVVEEPGSVHIWQGSEDFLVPVELQRMIVKKLPWIQYHEIPEKGHYLVGVPGMADNILESLVSGK